MLNINHLWKGFNLGTDREHSVFKDFSFSVEEGTTVAILGPNGCGKSTMFNLISGALSADDGEIWLDDMQINKVKEQKRSEYIGKVTQDPFQGVAPSLTIEENMAFAMKKSEPLSFKRLLKKGSQTEEFKAMLKTLDLGLEDQIKTEVKYLSGGQRQALSLLMATMIVPKLLLLDEHTAALDPKTSKLIMNKTKELIEEKHLTTIMISHNLRDAINYSDRIVMLNGGEVVIDVKSDEITEEELYSLYNRQIEEM